MRVTRGEGSEWYCPAVGVCSRHVVYAPSSVNQYGSSLFPGVSDAIFYAVQFGGSWDAVREQLDLVRIHILYASQIMSQSYSTTSGKHEEL